MFHPSALAILIQESTEFSQRRGAQPTHSCAAVGGEDGGQTSIRPPDPRPVLSLGAELDLCQVSSRLDPAPHCLSPLFSSSSLVLGVFAPPSLPSRRARAPWTLTVGLLRPPSRSLVRSPREFLHWCQLNKTVQKLEDCSVKAELIQSDFTPSAKVEYGEWWTGF